MNCNNFWPGLASYSDAVKFPFCGRANETNELFTLISNNLAVTLFGRSGCGKTSILNAGVFPLLKKRGFTPIYVRLMQKIKEDESLSFSEIIIRTIEESIKYINKKEDDHRICDDKVDRFWDYFTNGYFQDSSCKPTIPVIVLDQFEETFFTDTSKVSLLLRQIHSLINGSRTIPEWCECLSVRFVFSMRDDSLYRIENLIDKHNLTALKHKRYMLNSLSRSQAIEVITQPCPNLVDSDAAEDILKATLQMGNCSDYFEPALLSLLMSELYSSAVKNGSNRIDASLIREYNGNIVHDFYEKCVKGINSKARFYLESNLVTGDGRRRFLPATDIKGKVSDKDIEGLVQTHILYRSHRGKYTDYELSHDVLCPVVINYRHESEIKMQRRKLRLSAFIIVLMAAIASLFVAMVIIMRHQREDLYLANSELVAEKALALCEDGDNLQAQRIMADVFPKDLNHPDKPYSPRAEYALREAMTRNNAIIRIHNIVYSASFSPDGKKIVSASDDKTVRIWDAQSGDIINILEGHTGYVNSACFSPDGKKIVSASYDKTVRIWDAQSGDIINILEGHTLYVNSACFSPDGKKIVSASDDKTVRIWDAQSGDIINILEGHTSRVNSVCFSPDSKKIVSASSDKTVRIWDAQSGDIINILEGHTHCVNSVCFSPDGKEIVSGSWDETVRIWNARSGDIINIFEEHTDCVHSACFSPDGKKIVSASDDKTIRIWIPYLNFSEKILQGHTNDILSASFSPDGKRIVSASKDKTLRIWNIESTYTIPLFNTRWSWINSVCFCTDSKRIVSAEGPTIYIKDAESGYMLHILNGHRYEVNSVCLSPDGKKIVSASYDKTVRIWDAQSGDIINILEGHTSCVNSACFSPDGKWIVSASADTTIKIWDADSGDILSTLKGHNSNVRSACFSPDGKKIVSASDDKTVKIWDAQSGDIINILEGHTHRVISVCFSPDGKKIVSGSWDETVRIWDADTGAIINILEGHTDCVNSVCFSSDGKQIVSASDDKTVRIWDAQSGDIINILEGHTNCVNSACFSPDGKWIVSGSKDYEIRLWDYPDLQDLLDEINRKFRCQPSDNSRQ